MFLQVRQIQLFNLIDILHVNAAAGKHRDQLVRSFTGAVVSVVAKEEDTQTGLRR